MQTDVVSSTYTSTGITDLSAEEEFVSWFNSSQVLSHSIRSILFILLDAAF